jgi:hypothetical protein
VERESRRSLLPFPLQCWYLRLPTLPVHVIMTYPG